MENHRFHVLNCSSCGAQLKFDLFQETVTCEYCDSSFSVADMLNESEELRLEKNKLLATLEIEKGKREVESEYLRHQIEQEKENAQKEKTAEFKKSKISKALIVLSVIGTLFCITSFRDAKILSGFIAIAITVLAITSWLMGMQIVKEKKSGLQLILTIIAFALIIPYFHTYNLPSHSKENLNAENIVWSDLQLGIIIPKPVSTLGDIGVDLDTALSVTLYDIDEKECQDYIIACQKYGFTIESEKTSTTYSAFNNKGYKIRLVEGTDEFWIHLDAPEKMDAFEWPKFGLASILPKTKSNLGKISFDNSETFIVHIGNMSIDDFEEYIKSCQDKGFIINHSKSEKYYKASNKKGHTLTLQYLGFNRVEVALKAPEQ